MKNILWVKQLSLCLENLIKGENMQHFDEYQKFLKANAKQNDLYYRKSAITKTEQQKFLEKLLSNNKHFSGKLEIADIACGGGQFELLA